MPEVTITPKHERLQKFLAGKRVPTTDKPVTLELSDSELGPLLRKAKEFGFEDQIDVKKRSKADVKADAKAKAKEADEPSDETTADVEIAKAEEEGEPTLPRRRRIV